MIVLVVDALSILFLVVVLLWIIVPVLYGLPPIPTKPERIRKALKLAMDRIHHLKRTMRKAMV